MLRDLQLPVQERGGSSSNPAFEGDSWSFDIYLLFSEFVAFSADLLLPFEGHVHGIIPEVNKLEL